MHKKAKLGVSDGHGEKLMPAFTLLEATITLLIICIVVIMSTKMVIQNDKFAQQATDLTTWTCTWNSAGTALQVWDSVNKSTTSQFGNVTTCGDDKARCCVFTPPANVKKYFVTVIGGGGGGASGLNDARPFTKTSGINTFEAPATGDYYVILLGGGGGGGGNNCTSKPSQGGGSGAIIATTVHMLRGASYQISVANAVGSNNNLSTGTNANSTTMVGPGVNLEAKGGKGGFGYSTTSCVASAGTGEGGSCDGAGTNDCTPGMTGGSPMAVNNPVVSTVSPIIGATTGFDPLNPKAGGWACRGVMNSGKLNGYCLNPGLTANLNTDVNLGSGGDGVASSSVGTGGRSGFAMIVYAPIYGGSGGNPGTVSYHTYKKRPGYKELTWNSGGSSFTDRIEVYVGAGGAGATDRNSPGIRGEGSRFGGRIFANGGAGGEIQFNAADATKETAQASGGNGGKSPATIKTKLGNIDYKYDEAKGGFTSGNATMNGGLGTAPGAGGGGGGANASGFGTGGKGGDGLVIVSW